MALTVRELSKLYYIRKLIQRDIDKLAELEARLQPGGMNITGMPRNPSPKNLMEEIMPLIIDARDKLNREQREYEEEQARLENFIRSVNDYQIRLILAYRFIDLMAWNQVAQKLGGNNTEDGVKKACYRYLKKTEKS